MANNETMSKKLIPVAVALSTVLTVACTFMDQKTSPDTSITAQNVSFQRVESDLFSQSCVGCHSGAAPKGGVSLDTYSSVVSNIYKIDAQVATGQMPPDGGLSSYQKALFTEWYNVGAPNQAGGPPSITPSPIPSPFPQQPVDANYDSISANIFQIGCVSCHNPTGKASKVNLMDYTALLAGSDDSTWVVPGNPALSQLYVDITKTSPGNPPDDGARMPPFSTGAGLSQVQINVIQAWIQNGAPEHAPTITPTFSSIVTNIFEPHCASCHNPNSNIGKKVDIMTYANLTTPTQKWVVAGHPESSALYTDVAAKAKGRMPPTHAGPALTSDEIEIIQSWIQSGAQNN